jgi:hypothetical protein
MSHSNSTPNFNLPQFVGTDKPAWLTDINSAFLAIDTAVKNVSDAASTANGNATTANTNIGTLNDLTTTTKTNVVSAVNEVNSGIGTAQNTANQAYTAGTNALTKVTALEQALNLNTFNACTLNKSSGITSIDTGSNLTCATNSDKSLFKIYGRLNIAIPSNTANQSVTVTNTGLGSIDEAYTINCGALVYQSDGGMTMRDIIVNTDGSITIPVSTSGSGANYLRYFLFPMLYFNKSFGDQSE